MAYIANQRDIILQATSPRVVPPTFPSNFVVPRGQVSGLGTLAAQNQVNAGQVGNQAVTANSMAANSITAGNGAISDLSVDRLKINGLMYATEYVDVVNGWLQGTYYHYSGRNVLVYGGVVPTDGAQYGAFLIRNVQIISMQTNAFQWNVAVFSSSGVGMNGQVKITWGFL